VTAFLIDPSAAVIAAILVACLYFLLTRRVLRVRFGDARWGFIYTRLRKSLLKLTRFPVHPKNWRPMILVFTRSPEVEMTMVMYALWIGEARGIVTLGRVLVGDMQQIVKLRKTAAAQLEAFLQEHDFEALSSVVVAESLDKGLSALIQGHPFGPLCPNIVMMGWPSNQEWIESFVHHLNSLKLLNMSVIVVRDKGLPPQDGQRRIDVWWRGLANGSLMVLLTHLLTLNWAWADADIRLLRLIEEEAGREPSTKALRELLNQARLEAEVQVVVSTAPFPEVLQRHSADASVVVLGFNIPEEELSREFFAYFEEMTTGLPTTLMISSSGEADLFA
jgi:hypothetical protein